MTCDPRQAFSEAGEFAKVSASAFVVKPSIPIATISTAASRRAAANPRRPSAQLKPSVNDVANAAKPPIKRTAATMI